MRNFIILRLNYTLTRDCVLPATCTALIHPQVSKYCHIWLESCSWHAVIMWDENFTIFRLEFKFRKQTSQQQSEFLLIWEKQKPYLEFFVNYLHDTVILCEGIVTGGNPLTVSRPACLLCLSRVDSCHLMEVMEIIIILLSWSPRAASHCNVN